jgi:RHS repeat-associated protein
VDRRDLQGGPLAQERFEWDGMGKLRRVFDLVASVERYRADYDGGGERVRAVSNGVTRTYSGGLHEDDSNGSWTTHTPGVSQRANGTDSYFHSDWIGSTRYLTGANGLTTPSAYRFDGFGNVSAFAGADLTRFKFAGGHGYESDAHAGLQQLGARLYDPVVGRFISPNPIGFAGGMNLYGYCFGNPVGAVDPSGLDAGWAGNPTANDPYGFKPTRPRAPLTVAWYTLFIPVPSDSPRARRPALPSWEQLLASAIDSAQRNLMGPGLLGVPGGRGAGGALALAAPAPRLALRAPAQVVINRVTGKGFEDVVLRAIGRRLNTNPITGSYRGCGGQAVQGQSIPDILEGEVWDIKGVMRQSFDKQMQIQYSYARSNGTSFNLIVGPQSRVSAPLVRAVNRTGGRILRFDPKTGSFSKYP